MLESFSSINSAEENSDSSFVNSYSSILGLSSSETSILAGSSSSASIDTIDLQVTAQALLKEAQTTVAQPDVLIGSITAPTNIGTGQTLNFSYNIENQGDDTAASSHTTFYLSKDTILDSSDYNFGDSFYDYVDSLEPGVSSDETISAKLSSSLAVGDYYLMAKADSDNTITESNENNNVIVSSSTIAVSNLQSDLVIDSITTPTSAGMGEYLNVSYTVKNQGDLTAKSHYTGFYLSKDTTLDSSDYHFGNTYNYDYVSSLSPGSSSNETVSAYLYGTLAAGDYYLIAKADNWGYVTESDESNNVTVSSNTINIKNPQPDLVINSITTPTSAETGNNLNFSYNIKNQGDGKAYSSYTTFYLSKDTTLDSSDYHFGDYYNYDYVSSLNVGSSSNETVSAYLYGTLAAGDYYLIAKADNWGYVTESNETNNVTVSSSTVNIKNVQPDLVIDSITTPSTVGTGDYLDFSYNIKNQGDGTASASYTTFYLSKDTTLDSSDYHFGDYYNYDYVDYLSSGSSSNETVSAYLYGTLAAGDYYLIAKADNWGYVAESNETNNVTVSSSTVNIKNVQPDLVINSITTPSTVGTGNYLDFSYNLKNQGDGAASYSYTTFYLSKDTTIDSSDYSLSYDYVGSLSAGGSSNETMSSTISSSVATGDYYLIVKADGYGYITESNETNNVTVSSNKVSVKKTDIDLVIDSITVPSSAEAGESLNFSYTIKNEGSGTASYSYTIFYLSKDTTLDSSDYSLSYDYVGSLSAGGSSNETMSSYINSSIGLGDYYLIAKADNWGYVAESNEDNNITVSSNKIKVKKTQPDLVINSITVPSTVETGQNLSFSYNLKNQGDGTASYSYTRFYLSKDTTIDSSDYSLSYDYVGSLSAGGSSNETMSSYISTSVATGDYYLIVKADGYGYITESNETNNVTVSSNKVSVNLTKPDLVINSITVPSTVEVGENLSFSYNLKNQGDGTASASYTTFYLSKDTTIDSSDYSLSYDYIGSLSAGGSSNETMSSYISSSIGLGSYYLIAKADGYGYITESNENNNITVSSSTIDINKTQPDLVISSITVPSTVNIGDYFDFSYTINNQGEKASSYSSTTFYLSTDTTLDYYSDYQVDSDYVDSLSAGSSSDESSYQYLSNYYGNITAGDYYLIAVADGYGYVTESNESNNVTVSSNKITITDYQPDLVISTLDIPTSANTGEYFYLDYTIENQGDGDASDSYTVFYLSTDTTFDYYSDYQVDYDYVYSLSAGSSSYESAYLYLSNYYGNITAGDYYLIAVADGYGYISESNEDNNITVSSSTIAINTNSNADLTLSNLSVPTTAEIGDYFDLSYTITNQGGDDVDYSYTLFYLSTDTTFDYYSDYQFNFEYISYLGAGSSSDQSLSIYLYDYYGNITAGDYYLIAVADGYNYLTESDETNNILVSDSTIAITNDTQSDLLISSITTPTSASTGSYLDISYTVENQGDELSSYNWTSFYLSTDTTFDESDYFIDYDYVGELNAASSSDETVSLYLNNDSALESGDYYLIAVADGYSWSGYDYVNESDETNNVTVSSSTIAIEVSDTQPDLVVSSLDVPSSAVIGQDLNVSYTITNQGDGVAPSSYITFYLSTDTTFDSSDYNSYSYYWVSNISAGSSTSNASSLDLGYFSGLVAGDYYLIAVADPDDEITESDEDNNVTVSSSTIAISGSSNYGSYAQSPVSTNNLLLNNGKTVTLSDVKLL